jgi:hypothetical protein
MVIRPTTTCRWVPTTRSLEGTPAADDKVGRSGDDPLDLIAGSFCLLRGFIGSGPIVVHRDVSSASFPVP